MKLNEYQQQTHSTRLVTATEDYCILGLLGEAGEIASLHAKAIRDGEPHFKEKLTKELGDLMWFISEVATDNNLSLEFIAEENLRKLTSRAKRGTLKGSGDNR